MRELQQLSVEALTEDPERVFERVGAGERGDSLSVVVWETQFTPAGVWEVESAPEGLQLAGRQPLQAPLPSASNGTKPLSPGTRLQLSFEFTQDLPQWEIRLRWSSSDPAAERVVVVRS